MVEENANYATYTLASRVFEENHKNGQKIFNTACVLMGVKSLKGLHRGVKGHQNKHYFFFNE